MSNDWLLLRRDFIKSTARASIGLLFKWSTHSDQILKDIPPLVEEKSSSIDFTISPEQLQAQELFEIFEQLWLNHPLVANFFAKDKDGISNWNDLINNYYKNKDVFDKYEWVLYLIPWSDKNFARWWTGAESAFNEKAWSGVALWLRQFTKWTMQSTFKKYGSGLQKEYPGLINNDPRNWITSLTLSSKHLRKDLYRDWELDQSLALIWYHGWMGAKNALCMAYKQATGDDLITLHQIYAQIPPDAVIKYFATKKDNHEIYTLQVFAAQVISDLLESWNSALCEYDNMFKQHQVTTAKRLALDDIWYKEYNEQDKNLTPLPQSQELMHLLSVLGDLTNQKIQSHDNTNRYKRSKFTLWTKDYHLSVRAILAWKWVKLQIPQNTFNSAKLKIVLQYLSSYGLCTFAPERLPWWQFAYSVGIRSDLTIQDIDDIIQKLNPNIKTPTMTAGE